MTRLTDEREAEKVLLDFPDGNGTTVQFIETPAGVALRIDVGGYVITKPAKEWHRVAELAQQAEPVDEKAEFAAFGDWAMNDPTLPQAIGRLDGRDAGWRAWLARARKAAPLPLPAAPDTVQVPREITEQEHDVLMRALRKTGKIIPPKSTP